MKMANADEVCRIGKKLEKMISSNTADHSSTVDLLKTLQEMPMNLDVLQKTRIGMTVNNIRKASTKEENITLAKSLIKSWKKLLPADGPTSNSSSKGGSKKESKNSEKNGRDVDTSEGENSNSNSQPEKPATATTSVSDVGDPVRMKCRELIINALKPNGGDFETKYTPEEIGPQLEESIYQEFKNTDMKYKNRIRSRIANLKDSKNPRLRENVLLGLITPQKLAKMTAEEMASDEMKHLRAKYTKEAIDDHQMAKSGGTVTDLFKCGKCRKTNCTYNQNKVDGTDFCETRSKVSMTNQSKQVQTRSADEPMTTFVLCNECGNRWKFC